MKKSLIASLTYFILGLVGGVFYREFTKFYKFEGKTSLSVLHTHLFVLGAILFLLVALILKEKSLDTKKNFKIFFIVYNIFFPFFIVMLLVRGIIDVLNISIAKELNAIISGIAGLTHIGLAISLLLLIPILKDAFGYKKTNK